MRRANEAVEKPGFRRSGSFPRQCNQLVMTFDFTEFGFFYSLNAAVNRAPARAARREPNGAAVGRSA